MRHIWQAAMVISFSCAIALTVFISESTQLDRLPTHLPIPAVRSEFSRLAIIGDSWVARKGLDAPIAKHLEARGMHISVVSHGLGGANTRQIYRNILLNKNGAPSTASLLSDQGVRYCVIVAGINDSAGHLGSGFYAHHIIIMSKLLLAYGITPIVVEMPRFAIEDTSGVSAASAIKRSIFRHIIDGGKVNVIRDYRNALRYRISNEKLNNVILISHDTFTPKESRQADLYSDPAHLNAKGYNLLALAIADAVHTAQEWRAD